MTNFEAIEWLKYNRDELERYADTTDVLGGVYESDLKPTIEALDMAIAALEKQEGKKPREERFNYGAQGEYNRQYYCPCCNKWLAQKDFFGWFPCKPWMYCECGQRIDWSDEHGTD